MKIKLRNLVENDVIISVKEIMSDMDGVCACEKCMLDAAAIALNQLIPKYVVTDEGFLYSKLSLLDKQFNTDITTAVIKAIEIVSSNPRHEETYEFE